jgi:hypothetical protein
VPLQGLLGGTFPGFPHYRAPSGYKGCNSAMAAAQREMGAARNNRTSIEHPIDACHAFATTDSNYQLIPSEEISTRLMPNIEECPPT